MNTTQSKKTLAQNMAEAGLIMDYCHNSCWPETPYIQDVLHVLQLSPDQCYYQFCHSNYPSYIQKVHLVAAAVATEVLLNCWSEPNDQGDMTLMQDKARQIIARAIIDLSPQEAHCLFNPGYVAAAQILGKRLPNNSIGVMELRKACGCRHCREGR